MERYEEAEQPVQKLAAMTVVCRILAPVPEPWFEVSNVEASSLACPLTSWKRRIAPLRVTVADLVDDLEHHIGQGLEAMFRSPTALGLIEQADEVGQSGLY